MPRKRFRFGSMKEQLVNPAQAISGWLHRRKKKVLLPRAFLSTVHLRGSQGSFQMPQGFQTLLAHSFPILRVTLCVQPSQYLSLMNKSLKKLYLKHSRWMSILTMQNMYWCESILKLVFLYRQQFFEKFFSLTFCFTL